MNPRAVVFIAVATALGFLIGSVPAIGEPDIGAAVGFIVGGTITLA